MEELRVAWFCSDTSPCGHCTNRPQIRNDHNSRRYRTVSCLLLMLLMLSGSACAVFTRTGDNSAGDDWAYYHGSPTGSHYSRLKDINTRNVRKLKVAWIYDTRDDLGPDSTIESNPLIIGGRLFFISPLGRLICLDAATGEERWAFNPRVRAPGGADHWRRGVSYWTDGKDARIFFTFGNDLYAVGAETGLPVGSFGVEGRVPLGSRVSSPGAVYRNLLIVGGSDSSIRAFDVRTGDLRWKFNTIPRPGEFGHETWPKDAWKTAIGANNWAGLSLDETRGIVFAPLAFPQDFIGASRTGDNLFANCLIALDANNGQRLWHFQSIRHDLWDWDLPAPPTLVTVWHHGRRVDAVAQVSKVGFVYVLDRLTGRSLFPLNEKPAFPSDIPGVYAAPKQIEPDLPLPIVRQKVTSDLLTRRTPAAAAAVLSKFAALRSRGLWDPPSEQGTILLPGIEGGAEWGGGAFDPKASLLFVNANEMPWILKLKRRLRSGGTSGSALYQDHCAGCHGESREGHSPDLPSLRGISNRLTSAEIADRIASGGGRMPAFPLLAADEDKMRSLVAFLQTGKETSESQSVSDAGTKHIEEQEYILDSASKFVDPDGYPAITPPWGTLSAINLNSGRYSWRISLGEYPELVREGLTDTGSENYGGPIVTAGGLLFIGATSFDKKFRAYNSRTGALLWETVLPAPGNATPATYRVNGRQFVVIAAGGGRPGVIAGGLKKAESGSKIVAFTLPE